MKSREGSENLRTEKYIFLGKKKRLTKQEISFAVRTGLEPATLGVTGRYSNQLNYRTSSNTGNNLF